MTISYVLMQNLRRNRLRTVLTAAAFALPMAVFVAAISLVVALANMAAANEKELRLAVLHKVSLTNLLPQGMRRKIEEIDPGQDRIRAVCGMRWFGGRVPNTQNTLQSLAADTDTFPIVYSDLELTADERDQWARERKAAVVGLGTAEKHGWKTGDRVTLESTVPPYLPLEFLVIKVMSDPSKSSFFYFRRDYLEESLNAADIDGSRVNVFWVKCKSSAALRSLQDQIDALFANSPEETKSLDENALIASFTQAAGNIPGLMQTMAVVVVVIIALVAGNTMTMSFRERMRELAVFKAIGFQGRRVFFIVLGESLLLSLIGAVCGIVPTTVVLETFPARWLIFGPISALHVSPLAVVFSLGIAMAVGLAAGLWPAWQALRLRTVDTLRRVA